MRFPQLPIGRRFSYQGKTYTKTGPLTASEESTGKSQLIMKSAEVTPLDIEAAPAQERHRYSREEVTALCIRYRAELSAAIQASAGPQAGLPVKDVLELIAAHPLPFD